VSLNAPLLAICLWKIAKLWKWRGNREGGGTTSKNLHLLLSFVCFSSY